MNKTDPLVAAFRQIASHKAAPRTALPAVKDGKDKADQFREQLRSISHGTKPAAQAEVGKANREMEASPDNAKPVQEATDDVTKRAKDRVSRSGDKSHQRDVADTVSVVPEWRGQEGALSAVISRLDQFQAAPARDDVAVTQMSHHHSRVEPDDIPQSTENPMDASVSDGKTELRFALTSEVSDTRLPSLVKVAVREQQTHFEPVQQPMLLQKIVDSMAMDLSTAATQAGPEVSDTTQPDLHQSTDKPVRMLTLELDPPDLGAVTVRMRLAGDAVEIRLTADRYETSQMLQKERGTLADAMQSAGYKFDIASIDHGRAGDATSGQSQQQAQPDQRSSQQSFNGPQIDSGASGRHSGESQAGARHSRQEHEQRAEPTERHQARGALRDSGDGSVYL